MEECLFKNLKLIKFKTEDIFLSNLQCENKNVTIKTLIWSNFNLEILKNNANTMLLGINKGPYKVCKMVVVDTVLILMKMEEHTYST